MQSLPGGALNSAIWNCKFLCQFRFSQYTFLVLFFFFLPWLKSNRKIFVRYKS